MPTNSELRRRSCSAARRSSAGRRTRSSNRCPSSRSTARPSTGRRRRNAPAATGLAAENSQLSRLRMPPGKSEKPHTHTHTQDQIPLSRLPREHSLGLKHPKQASSQQTRDKPVTSPLAQIPLRRLPRNFPSTVQGSFGEVGVMEFGLHRAS